MMNYTNLLYCDIGNRVKKYRNTPQKKSQTKFCLKNMNNQIDIATLSRIENGKADKNKNPYLLSIAHIEILCNFITIPQKITPTELIWGTEQEREDFVKLIILAILMNSDSINPFENKTVEDWFKNETMILPFFEKEKRDLLSDDEFEYYLKDKYGFFLNSDNYYRYEKFENKFNKDFEKISNLILKLILQDFVFSKKFIQQMINFTNHTVNSYNDINDDNVNKSDGIRKLIENFVTNKGEYSIIILDNKSNNYHIFITAFNKFWNKYREHYMKFFNDNLFLKTEELLPDKNPLKILNNKYINEMLISKEFIELNEDLLLLSDYVDNDSALSNMNFKFMLQGALQENLFIEEKNDMDFSFCMRNIMVNAEKQIELYYQSK